MAQKAPFFMKNTLQKSLFTLACVAATWAAAPAWAQTVPLLDVVRQVLREYPAAASALAQQQAAQSGVAQAEAARYPVLSLGASATNQKGLDRKTNLGPQISYTLFAGGAIEAGVRRAEAELAGAVGRSGESVNNLAVNVAEAYLNWARALELQQLARDNLRSHIDIREDVRIIVGVDAGRQMDLNQVAVRVSNARILLAQRDNELARATAAMQRFLPGFNAQGPAGLDDLPMALPRELAEALRAIDDSHPLLRQASARYESATAQVGVARGQTLPKVDLNVSRQFSSVTRRNEPTTQVLVNMPVFSGGAGRAAVAGAVAQQSAAQLLLDEQRRVVQEGVAMSWADWTSAQTREQESAGQARVSLELVGMYRQQFRLARRSLLDLLNVQNEAYNFGSEAVGAKYERRLAAFKLSGAMGRLAPALGFSAEAVQ